MKPDTTEALGDAIYGFGIATINSALRDPGVTDPELCDPTYGYEIELAECAVDALEDERQRLAEAWEPDERDYAPQLETAAYLAHQLNIDESTAERLLGALARLGYTRQEVGHDEHGDLAFLWRRLRDAMFGWLFCSWVPRGIAGIDPEGSVLDSVRRALPVDDNRSLAVEAALMAGERGVAWDLARDTFDEIQSLAATE